MGRGIPSPGKVSKGSLIPVFWREPTVMSDNQGELGWG